MNVCKVLTVYLPCLLVEVKLTAIIDLVFFSVLFSAASRDYSGYFQHEGQLTVAVNNTGLMLSIID